MSRLTVTKKTRVFSGALTTALLIFGGTTAAAAPLSFSDIYLLGDSLSDTGNTSSVLGEGNVILDNIAGYGSNDRFSNGPVWHEYLADSLGVSRAQNSLDGGNNYAYGGARVDDETGFSAGLITQKNRYFDDLDGASSDPEGLYIAWAGGNDMRDLVGEPEPANVINQRLDSLVTILSGLLDSGANTLLVPNLPNLGQIPENAMTPESESATAVTTAWNTGLEERLNDLSTTTDASILYFDVFGLFEQILNDTTNEFGFTNTTDQCRSVSEGFLSEQECDNSDSFLFWDQIHPTTAAHEQLGLAAFDRLASANGAARVPEPATFWLLLVSMLAVAGRRLTRING